MIIIKRFENFTNENKLLKIPASVFKDFDKNNYSKKKGKVTCLLKLPKNRFDYFEKIPFEIFLDFTELKSEVKNIELFLNMKITIFYKRDEIWNKYTKKNISLVSREYSVDKSQKKLEIKDYIELHKDSKFSEYISLNEKYKCFEDMKKIEVDNNLEDITLTPFSLGEFIKIEYELQVRINYKNSFMWDTSFLPIDLDYYDNGCFLVTDNNERKNIISSGKDIDRNNLKQKMEESEGFVIFEEDDFEKVLLKIKINRFSLL